MLETQFINDRTLRDFYIEHYEVLEKVKKIIITSRNRICNN